MEKQNQKNGENLSKDKFKNVFFKRNAILISLLIGVVVLLVYSKVSSNEGKVGNPVFQSNNTTNSYEGNEIILTKMNFDKEVLKSDKLVMVDFWATWCGPCRMTAPIVKSLADQYKGKMAVGKVDVDQNRDLAEAYSISAIPTILFFKDGKIIDRQIGMTSKENLEEKIINLLK